MQKNLVFYTTGVDPNRELRFKVFEGGSEPELPEGAEKLIGVGFEKTSDQDIDRDIVVVSAFLAGARFRESNHPIFGTHSISESSGALSLHRSPESSVSQGAPQSVTVD